MKLSIEYKNIDECFYAAVRDHRNHGIEQQIRGTTRYEILDYSISLGDPSQNILFIPFRYTNFPAIIAETVWVFAGRYDLWFLGYYLKSSYKYSDDGETWRAAYSRRLVDYATTNDDGNRIIINQIDRMVTYLSKDLQTTRGVLVIPDGSDYHLNEYDEEKLDEPCTMFVQYVHRGSDLNCFVRMRSNDVMLGCFNVNLFEWTFLQQLMANQFYTNIGSYNINAVSMHVYNNWMKKLPLMLENQLPVDVYSIISPKQLTITWSEFKKQIHSLLELELLFRNSPLNSNKPFEILYDKKFHTDINDIMLVMMITMTIKKKEFATLKKIFSLMNNDPWLVACLEYAARRLGPSMKGFVIGCFNETLRDTLGGHEEAILNYILHSFTEQEAIERLEGLRPR